MRDFYFRVLLTSILLVTSCAYATAQAVEARNLATDTLQPANAKYYLPVSRIRTLKGQTLYVFLRESSDGQSKVLEFTWRHPLTLPRPKPVIIKLSQVQWVVMQGNYCEPVRLRKGDVQTLAWRPLAGSPVELFTIAWPKARAISFVPLVGQATDLLAKRDSSDYQNYWLVRRSGQLYMQAVPTKKAFAPFLAGYLADNPDLATAIRAQARGYGYDDVPHIIQQYNQAANPK